MSGTTTKAEGRSRGGRPAKITPQKILDVASKIPAHELTFPAVAKRLGVRPAALYYHFASRDVLLGALSERIVAEFDVPEPEPQRWQEWLIEFALSLHQLFVANPVILESRSWALLQPISLPMISAVLETLMGAGFSAQDSTRLWSIVGQCVQTAAREHILRQSQGYEEEHARWLAGVRGQGGAFPQASEVLLRFAQNSRDEGVEGQLRWLIAQVQPD